MTIGPFIDMTGAVDVHVHSEPDLFPRIADDVGVARHAASLGLRAVSLKCHSERTTSRAYLTMQQVPHALAEGQHGGEPGIGELQCKAGKHKQDEAGEQYGVLPAEAQGHACDEAMFELPPCNRFSAR